MSNIVASFMVDPDLWRSFKEACRLRGTTVCAELETLMRSLES